MSDGSVHEIQSPPQTNLIGRWTTLRGVAPADEKHLFDLVLDDPEPMRWRFRPGTLRFEAFREALWSGVLCQFVVVHSASRRLLGLVTAYQPDLTNGTCSIASVLDPKVRARGWPFEGTMLFLQFLFQNYPLRKVYAEVAEYNMTQYGSGTKDLFDVEGRFRQHIMVADQYFDVYHLATYRKHWVP